MLKVSDLASRYGLTERQVHLRLAALDGLINGHVQIGKFNAKLVDNYTIELFDQLMQLESDGLTTQAAVDRLKNELGTEDGKSSKLSVEHGEAIVVPYQELIMELRVRIEALERDKAYLQSKVDDLLAQLQETQAKLHAMLPGTKSKRWWHFWC